MIEFRGRDSVMLFYDAAGMDLWGEDGNEYARDTRYAQFQGTLIGKALFTNQQEKISAIVHALVIEALYWKGKGMPTEGIGRLFQAAEELLNGPRETVEKLIREAFGPEGRFPHRSLHRSGFSRKDTPEGSLKYLFEKWNPAVKVKY